VFWIGRKSFATQTGQIDAVTEVRAKTVTRKTPTAREQGDLCRPSMNDIVASGGRSSKALKQVSREKESRPFGSPKLLILKVQNRCYE
jgi:hypothetical protein